MSTSRTAFFTLTIIAISLSPLAARAEAIQGWVLTPPAPEENLIVDPDIWTLTPPDGRPSTSLRASVAKRVQDGSLSPEAAYTGGHKNAKAAASADNTAIPLPSGTPDGHGQDLSLDNLNNSAPPAGTGRAPATAANDPVPAAPTTPPEPWNPDGKTKPYNDYNTIRLACEKAEQVTQPSWTKPYREERQPWDPPEGNMVASCKDADLEEEVRRVAYDICSPEEADRFGHYNQGGTLDAWVSKQQVWQSPHGEVGTAYGIYTCKSGRDYEVFIKLGEWKGECWACGMQSSYISDPAFAAKRKSKLNKIDLTAGPRTSPHESESPDRAAYWPK